MCCTPLLRHALLRAAALDTVLHHLVEAGSPLTQARLYVTAQPSACSCLRAAHSCCDTHCCALLLSMPFHRLLRSSFDHREPGSALRPHLRLCQRGGQTAVKMKETCQRAGSPHYQNQAERPVPSRHPASLYALTANRHNFLRISPFCPSSAHFSFSFFPSVSKRLVIQGKKKCGKKVCERGKRESVYPSNASPT